MLATFGDGMVELYRLEVEAGKSRAALDGPVPIAMRAVD